MQKIACLADNSPKAQDALSNLGKIHDFCENAMDAEIIIALGGDGFMLHILHQFMGENIAIYGMNCGTVGFLLNSYSEYDLFAKLQAAIPTTIHPIRMRSLDNHGNQSEALAINEVSLLRETKQTAKIRVSVDGVVRIEELVCDGAMVSTPAGSSAYNFSVGGPIIPLGAEILALTPIAPFRPRRWKGALLPSKAMVKFEVLEAVKRPVSAVADFTEFRDIISVEVSAATDYTLTLLFDPDHSLEDRIIREQFLY